MPSKILSLIKNEHFLSLSGNIIMSGIGMLTTAVLYRALKPDEAGVWVLFYGTILFVDTFRSGFITTAFIKFYAGSTPERANAVIGSTWFIAGCITAGLVLLNLPALFFIGMITDKGYVLFLQYFSVAFIFMLPQFVATCILQGDQRFDRLLYVRLVNQGSFVLFLIILFIMQKGQLMYVLYAYLLSQLITSLYTLLMGWTGIRNFGKRTGQATSDIFHFGKFSVGTTLSANMFRYSDLVVINEFVGPAAVAVYNLGQSLMQFVEIPLRSFAATGMPALSAAYNKDSREEVIYIMKRYVGLLTVILLPCAILGGFLADIPIMLMGGGKYAGTEIGHQAANVFRLFLTFALLYPAERFFALTLDVIHKPKINLYKVFVMLAGNIIFDVVGVLVFHNVYGVALASVVPTLIGLSIGYFALIRYQHFSFISVFSHGVAEAKVYMAQLQDKIRKR